MKQRRLGDMLVVRKILTQDQLNAALKQKKPGEKIGETLMRLGLITEDQLVETLCLQLDMEPVDLDKVRISKETLALVPEDEAKEGQILPVKATKDTLSLAMTDPMNVCVRTKVAEQTGRKVVPLIAKRDAMERALKRCYAKKPKTEKPAASPAPAEDAHTAESAAAGFAGTILLRAKEEEASDILIEPEAGSLSIRMRIDGILRRTMTCAPDLAGALQKRLLAMAGITGEQTMGEIHSEWDYAVSVLSLSQGMLIHLKRLTVPEKLLTLAGLGMTKEQEGAVQTLLSQKTGVVLIASPAKGGRSTSLLSILHGAQAETRSVLALTKSISPRDPGLFQVLCPAGEHFDARFAGILRQDPDIVGIDGLDCPGKGTLLRSAAESGHLVLATVRAGSVKEAADFAVSCGIPKDLIRGVIFGHLEPLVCPSCHGEGCTDCYGTGVRGRKGVYELETFPTETENVSN